MNNRTATKALPVVQMNLTDIVIDADLRYRHINVAHTRDLLNALRRAGNLAAVLVWIDDRADSPTIGKALLVDGGHRLAAYFNDKRKNIPCRAITGTFAETAVKALAANTRDTLSLTQQERSDGAWRLVRAHGLNLTGVTIANAAGVTRRTVQAMRKRWREMTAAEADATGEWWRDKADREGQPGEPMTDEEREGKIDDLAEALRKAAGMTPSRDIQLLGDALHRAFGRHLKDAAEYLFTQPEDGEGGGHWSDPLDTNLGPEAPF